MAYILSMMLRADEEASEVFQKLEGETAKFKSDIMKHSKEIGMGMTAFGGSILAIGGFSVKAFSEFDAGMRSVNSMMNLGDKEFAEFSQEVRHMSVELGVNAVESTKALYQAISAGVPKENAIDFLEVASKAAIAGLTDTETAVDGLTTVINAFKIPMEDAQEVADIFFATVKGGKTTFPELASYMSQVAPIAASMKLDFKEVAAATATLTKQGTPTSQAMRQIRASLISLTKPTEDMKTLLNEMGYESGEAALHSLGYAGAMEELRIAANGNNEALARAFGSVEGLNAALAVSGNNAVMAAQDLEAMSAATDGAGAATDAFSIINDGAGRQWESLMATIDEWKMQIGETVIPVLLSLMGTMGGVITKVTDWMEDNPTLAKTIIAIVAVVGTLAAVLGPILIILPTLVTGFHLLVGALAIAKTAMIAFGATMTTTTGIIGAVALVITGVVLALQHFHKESSNIVEVTKGLSEHSLPQLRNMHEIVANQLLTSTEGSKEYYSILQRLKDIDEAITQAEQDNAYAQEAVAEATAIATGAAEEQARIAAEQEAALKSATDEIGSYEEALEMAQADLERTRDAFEKTKEQVAELEEKLRETKSALQDLKAPRLTGTQEFEDEMFRIQHNINQLKLATMDEAMNVTLQVKDENGNIVDKVIPQEAFEQTMEDLKKLEERTELKWTVDTEGATREIREAAEQALGENTEIGAQDALDQIADLAAQIAPDGELMTNLNQMKARMDMQENAVKIKEDVVRELSAMVVESKKKLEALKAEFEGKTQDIVDMATRAMVAWEKVLSARLAAESASSNGGSSVPSMATGGIVPGRPGEPVAIIAHGGEEFLGVGQYRKSSGPQTVVIPINLGGREIARYTVNLITEEVESQGALN